MAINIFAGLNPFPGIYSDWYKARQCMVLSMGQQRGSGKGRDYEPTCTWRSNILPLAHTGQWQSRHGVR